MNAEIDDSKGRAAFENHLAFIKDHRASVERRDDGIYVKGQAEFLTFWCAGNDPSANPREKPEIRTLPWFGADWICQLSSLGYERSYVLDYMILGTNSAQRSSDNQVRKVSSENDARDFANVQIEGFLTADDPHRSWWINCFHRMAKKNYLKSSESFFLTHVDGVPASVMLTVATSDCLGIYAVATVPAFRGRGLSTCVLSHVLDEEREGMNRPIILQVESGSYAQGLYKHHGFEMLFSSEVFVRNGTIDDY